MLIPELIGVTRRTTLYTADSNSKINIVLIELEQDRIETVP